MKLYSYKQIQEIEAASLEERGTSMVELNATLGAEAAEAIADVLAWPNAAASLWFSRVRSVAEP